MTRRPVAFALSLSSAGRFFLELFLVLGAYFAYHLVRGAVNGRVDVAFSNADALIRFERALGIFWEVELQGLIIGHGILVDLFNWVYVWGFLPVVGGLALWIYAFHRTAFARYRNAFLISGAIGLVFYVSMPMAPPRFLPDLGFIDTITVQKSVYHALQQPALVNEYAAMPSLHVGWILLVGVALFQMTRAWYTKAFAMMLPLLMTASIIFTANHYFLDAVVGVAVTLVALWIAGVLNRRFEGTPIHTVLV